MAYMESDRRGSPPQLARLLSRVDPVPGPLLPAAAVRLERLAPLFITLVILAAWELAVRLGAASSLLFPAPSVIAAEVVELAASGELFAQTGVTLARVGVGVALGGLPGLLLGLCMGWSARLHRLVDPFIAAAHPLPKIALFPLVLIFFGIGETSKVAVAASGAFFPILINALAGVRQINPLYFEVARSYRARPLHTFRRVILPASLPSILTGLRLAVNVTLLLTVSVEMVGGREGLGSMIWWAWETMHTEDLYVSLFLITMLGLGFNWAMDRLSAYLAPWQVSEPQA